MLAALFMFTSCELVEEGIDYTTLTRENYDDFNLQFNNMESSIDDDAQELEEENAIDDAIATPGTTVEYSGTGFSGSINFTDNLNYTVTLTEIDIFDNKSTAAGVTPAFTYSGTQSLIAKTVWAATADETTETVTGTVTLEQGMEWDITFTGATYSTFSGNLGSKAVFDVSMIYTEGYEPTINYTGTLTVDGINYRASEFMAFAMADES